MKSLRIAASFVWIACSMFAAADAAAEEDRDWSGPAGESYQKLYTARTFTSFEGVVKSVGTFAPGKQMSRGVLVSVELDTGERRTVHLGPEWFVKAQEFKVTKGERVSVVGSRIEFQKQPAIMASEITNKEGKLLKLRDDKGLPIWQGDDYAPPRPAGS